jgi:hypothetical protein
MTAATDKELSDLHNKVAKVLLQKLDSSDQATLLLAEFSDDLPEEVVEYLEKQMDASPALLTVITKFLKDNDITAVVDESKELTDLDRRLAEKRQRKVSGVSLVKDED